MRPHSAKCCEGTEERVTGDQNRGLIWKGARVKGGTFKLKLEGVTQGKRFSRKLVHWVLSGMAQSAEDLR